MPLLCSRAKMSSAVSMSSSLEQSNTRASAWIVLSSLESGLGKDLSVRVFELEC